MTKLEKVLKEIKSQGNAERAIADQRYHKSKRVHWGVSAPQSHLLARSFSKELSEPELLQLAQALWMTNLFNPMICACKILALPSVKPSQALWKILVHFLNDVDGWGLEDSLAPVAWKCVLADETLLDEIEGWSVHPNFWMRRAALVYTLPFAKPNRDPEKMLKWASSYASDKEWFIQKAIGWWLRVLGSHDPERVYSFLEAHWLQLKGVARKEATRKLSLEWQQKIKSSLS